MHEGGPYVDERCEARSGAPASLAATDVRCSFGRTAVLFSFDPADPIDLLVFPGA